MVAATEMSGDCLVNITVPHRAKTLDKPVRHSVFSFINIQLTTFIVRDTINYACGSARKTLSDNVSRITIRNNGVSSVVII